MVKTIGTSVMVRMARPGGAAAIAVAIAALLQAPTAAAPYVRTPTPVPATRLPERLQTPLHEFPCRRLCTRTISHGKTAAPQCVQWQMVCW